MAAIPENEPVSTVADAKQALKPEQIRTREAALGVSYKASFRRRNTAFVRQGEWFFIPAAELKVDPLLILNHEPLTRGNGGKPHWADECYRLGGETVYVSGRYPSGLTAGEFIRLSESERKRERFRMMKRDVAVYVRGEVTHPDHKTVYLQGWHRVFVNTENRSVAMRFLAFLD